MLWVCDHWHVRRWETDDGSARYVHPATFSFYLRCLNLLISPAGTFDVDHVLADCPEPAKQWDDNAFKLLGSCPCRLVLGEVLEEAGMYEKAIAQVQPVMAFCECNPQSLTNAWLLGPWDPPGLGSLAGSWR